MRRPALRPRTRISAGVSALRALTRGTIASSARRLSSMLECASWTLTPITSRSTTLLACQRSRRPSTSARCTRRGGGRGRPGAGRGGALAAGGGDDARPGRQERRQLGGEDLQVGGEEERDV